MFSKLAYAMLKKWEIKLCISVNIYHRLLKLDMRTHVFKISLCYHKISEIKLCVSVNIYCRLPKLGMGTDCFQNYPVLLTKNG